MRCNLDVIEETLKIISFYSYKKDIIILPTCVACNVVENIEYTGKVGKLALLVNAWLGEHSRG